jgi:hypothetical protein
VLLERGAIKFAGGEPGSLAQKTIADWRRETGIGSASLPAPLPPAKTSEELYAEQIISDWNTLSSDQFKARLASDRKYRETFRQLSETDRITVRAQKPKSDEQLEQEVIADYRHLPGKEFQAKRRNSAAYDAMYVKLANENRISL